MAYTFTITNSTTPSFTVTAPTTQVTVNASNDTVNVTTTSTPITVASTSNQVTIENGATLVQTKSLYDTFRGDWQYGAGTAIHYSQGDFVRYNNQMWMCSTPYYSNDANGYPGGSDDVTPNPPFVSRWVEIAVGSIFTATSGNLNSLIANSIATNNLSVSNTATMGNIAATDAEITNITVSTLNGLQYPSTDGLNKQVLTTNGSGTLYWSTVSAIATLTTISGDLQLKDSNNETTVYASSQTGVLATVGTHYIGISDNSNYKDAVPTFSTSTQKGVVVTNEGGVNDAFYNNDLIALNGTGSTSTTYPYPSTSLDNSGRNSPIWTPTYWGRSLKNLDPALPAPAYFVYTPDAVVSAGANLSSNTSFWTNFLGGSVTPPQPQFGTSAIGISTYNPGANNQNLADGADNEPIQPGWISAVDTTGNLGTGDFTFETWAYVATPSYRTETDGTVDGNLYPRCPIIGYGRFYARQGANGTFQRGYELGIDVQTVGTSYSAGSANNYRKGLGWQLNLSHGSLAFEAGDVGIESTCTYSGQLISTPDLLAVNGSASGAWWVDPVTGNPSTTPTTKTYQKLWIQQGLVDLQKLVLAPIAPYAAVQNQLNGNAAFQGYNIYNDIGFKSASSPAIPYDTWFHVAVQRKNGMASIWINGVKQKLWKQYYGYLASDPDIYEIPLTKGISVGNGQYHIWGPTFEMGGFQVHGNPRTDWKFVQGVDIYNAAKYSNTFTPEARNKINGLHPSYRPLISVRDFTNQMPAVEQAVTKGGEIRFEQANGDFQVVTNTLNTDVLGNLDWRGWNGSGAFVPAANIRAIATQDWNTSTRQTKLQFQVIGTNTNTLTTPVEITDRLLRITSGGIQFPDGTIQTTAGGGNNPSGQSNGGSNSSYDFGTIEIPSGTGFDGGPIITG